MTRISKARREFARQLPLQVFVWMGLLFLILFSIIPMSGIIIAFKDYNIRSGFAGMFMNLPMSLNRLSILLLALRKAPSSIPT